MQTISQYIVTENVTNNQDLDADNQDSSIQNHSPASKTYFWFCLAKETDGNKAVFTFVNWELSKLIRIENFSTAYELGLSYSQV